MTIKTYGPLAISDIHAEFGGNRKLSNYYRGGGLVPNVSKNYSISTGGRIANSMFYGAQKELPPAQLAIAAATYRNGFTRSAPFSTGAAMPDAYWDNSPWSRYTAAWNLSWYFNNTAVPDTEDWCTVVCWNCGGGPYNFQINAISTTAGYVGYTTVFHKVIPADNGQYSGTMMAMYHVPIDRNKILTIDSTINNHHGGNRATAPGLTILPGRYVVTDVEIPIANAGKVIYQGEIHIMLGAIRSNSWQDFSAGTSSQMWFGIHWYNSVWTSLIFGDSTRSYYWNNRHVYRVSGDYDWGSYVASKYILKKYEPGVTNGLNGSEPYTSGMPLPPYVNPDNGA